jgi:nucleoid-associated protein YgaU
MALTDKYAGVIAAAQSLGIKGFSAKEVGGKLTITGTADYEIQKDAVWDEIKKQSGWEQELSADIKTANTDIYGIYEVKPGDSLSKIAKSAYDNAGAYMRIFEANRNILKDPNVIQPGQKLVIPKK